ncbi:MAG TPA: hypothetical protein VFV99_13940 [Kofleriaceae bacterium]|nr:hypothetical protein [Kofleriaceae bacterium]
MRKLLSLFLLVAISGCPGSAPPNVADRPDAAGGGDDAAPTSFLLSGKVMDYFGATAIEGAMVATDGLDPPLMTSSAADGAYSLDVAVGSSLFINASKANYRPTRNAAMSVADMPVTKDVYLMTDQDVKNQYTAVGATPVLGTAILIAEMRRNDGTPLEGIPLTNVTLLDAQNQPVATVKGPYFFNAAGSVDLALTTATAYQGRSRVAILDVPPGTYTLAVTYLNGMNQNTTNNTPVTTVADGGTLAISGGMGGGGGGGGGNNVTDPSFATDIYPKLQRAAAGGLGCANCHTLSGPAAVLKYDEAAGTVLANIIAATGVVNSASPADSLLLKRPLYEAPPTPQDHPNATFLDVNDADYKLFLLWITKGAKP